MRANIYGGMRSPWGTVSSVKPITDWLGWVATPSHGGVKVRADYNRRIPDYMRKPAGWYEEDCNWAIPYVVFTSDITAETGQEYDTCEHAVGVLRNWNPAMYERFFGVQLVEGQSFIRDQELFYKQHENDLIVFSVFGDWHAAVPTDMVGVLARVGNRTDNSARAFLIPAVEYNGSRKSFVVEPTSYTEVATALFS